MCMCMCVCVCWYRATQKKFHVMRFKPPHKCQLEELVNVRAHTPQCISLVCACVCLCMYVCMHAYEYVYMRVYACMCVCMDVYVRERVWVDYVCAVLIIDLIELLV